MVSILNFRSIFFTLQTLTPYGYGAFLRMRYCHYGSEIWDQNLNLATNGGVGIFWDLHNKPPNSNIPPYELANKLRVAASSFGVVWHMVAYSNTHTFSHVHELSNPLEKKGVNVIKPNEPYFCQVCGRKFCTNERLVNHFKQLHEPEHMKRLNVIESAKGTRRVKLVAKYSMKMEKYKKAARVILAPKVGYGIGLADELRRAGFWVQTMLNKPQAADLAVQSHMVNMTDRWWVECMVLVSDDSDFGNVIKEAKLRRLKTVVVGDTNDGVLKRTADAAFSWEEILRGRAKKEAVSVVENWKNRDIFKRLEWIYNPEVDKKKFYLDDTVIETSEDDIVKDICDEVDDAYKDDTGAWWELDSDDNVTNGQSGEICFLSMTSGEIASSFSVVVRMQCYTHKSSFHMGALVACLGNKRNFSSNTCVPVIGGPNTSDHASNNPSRSFGTVGGLLKYTSGETYSVLQAGSLQHWFKNWQTLRKHKLTASTFASAIGFWRQRRVQLWLEKLGAIEPFSGNLATCWSNIKEEEALERYKLITGNTVLFPEFQVYGADREDNWLAASPDGIVDSLVYELPSRGVLEIKCPYFNGDMSRAFPWSRIPIYYIPQAQGLMEILGRDWMDFYVWTPHGSSLFRLHRDAEYWYVMKMALSDFWWKHVQPARELYSSNVITNPLFQLRSLRPAPRHELCSYIVNESKRIVDNSKLLMREIHGKLRN